MLKTKQKKILNIGHPRVGNTWIGHVMSYALNAQFVEYDIDGNYLIDSDIDEVIFKIGGEIPDRINTSIIKIEKTHFLPDQWKNIDENLDVIKIYLHRNLRDAAVSYFHYSYNHRPFVETGKVKESNYFERKFFIMKKIRSHLIHKERWNTCVDGYITYEDMKNDGYNTIANLFESLNIQYDEEYLKEALDFFSWENTTKMEKKLRKPGTVNNKEFFRSGISGSYKKEFDLLDYIFSIIAYISVHAFFRKPINFVIKLLKL